MKQKRMMRASGSRVGMRLALLTIATFAPILSFAQLQSLDSTRDGRGTLDFSTRVSSTSVRRVRVVLRTDHRAEIHLLSGASERFVGRWRGAGLNKVYLDIDRVGNDPAIGTGQVTHDARGEFVSAFCSGSVGNRKFDFSFNTDDFLDRPGGGGGGSNRELNITSPRNGSNVTSSRVEIEGTSRARDVNVRVFDSEGRLVANRNLDVRGHRWSTQLNLDRGRYRVVARDMGSRKTDEVSFTYRRRDENDEDWIQEFKDNAKRAVRNRFDGYELVFRDTTVSRETFGNRSVRSEFEARGKGSRRGDYRMTVVCDADTAAVKSVSYSRT